MKIKQQLFFINLLILYAQLLSLTKETILVTGGTGFIGTHVTEKLLDQDNTVIIIDNLNNLYDAQLKQYNLNYLEQKHSNHHLRIYKMDICDPQKLRNVFEQEHPTIICHLAAASGVSQSITMQDTYVKTNIMGTLNLLEMAKIFGIKHFIFISSNRVYRQTSPTPFEETDPADRPCSPYAATKRTGELFAYMYHYLYGLPCTCLRLFTVYGPRGRPNMSPLKFLDALHKENLIILDNDQFAYDDFVYIDDVVSGIIKALDNPYNFEIFNIGSGISTSTKEFINIVEQVVHKKANIIIKKAHNPAQHIKTHADITKAQKIIRLYP